MLDDVPVREVRNRKIRLKLTDFCNLQCPFCHSEGAVGANDVDVDDRVLLDALSRLRESFDAVHLTGGEPTSYHDLDRIVALLRSLDYKIAITSNGLFNVRRVSRALALCEYVNISFHTLTPGYFEAFVRTPAKSARTIDVITSNVDEIREMLPVRFNTVISGAKDEQQLRSVHEFAESRGIPLKLVPDWRSNHDSKRYAHTYLADLGYTFSEVIKIVPGSNVRRMFTHPQRLTVELKDIEHFRPDFLCEGCQIVDKCVESLSFVRIERSPAQFRLCIYKPEMTADAFFDTFDRNLKPLFAAAAAELD